MTAIAKRAGCSLKLSIPLIPISRRCLGRLSHERRRGHLTQWASEPRARFAGSPDTLRCGDACDDGKTRHSWSTCPCYRREQNFPDLAKNFWNEGYGRALEVVKIFLCGQKSARKPEDCGPSLRCGSVSGLVTWRYEHAQHTRAKDIERHEKAAISVGGEVCGPVSYPPRPRKTVGQLGNSWHKKKLAESAGMSRSALAVKFREKVGA